MSKRVAAKVQDFQYQIDMLKREISSLENEREELRWVINQNKVGTDQIREQLEEAKNSVKVETVEVVKMPKIKLIDNCCRDVTFDYDDGILTIEVE